MLDQSYEGREFTPFQCEVDRCKIKELSLAAGEHNPVFTDRQLAREQGYKDTPAPLTFATVMLFWGYPVIWDRLTEMGFDLSKMLHTREDYEYIDPIYPGDRLEGRGGVESVTVNSLAQIAVFKCTFYREEKPVLICRLTMMVAEGV